MKKPIQTITLEKMGEATFSAWDGNPDTLNAIALRRGYEMLTYEWADMDVRERVAVLSAVTRVQVQSIKIQENAHVSGHAGATVRKYEKAFQANATRKRKPLAGSEPPAALIANGNDTDDNDDELEY